jgi:hypothetical protein
MHYFKFFVPSLLEMVDAVKNQTIKLWDLNGRHKDLIFQPFMPEKITEKFNAELSCYAPYQYKYCTVFARAAGQKQKIHVDGNLLHGMTHMSLNIPVFGGNGTMMHWYTGDYQIVETVTGKESVNKYFELQWNNEPKKINSVEVNESYIVRVDIPHSVDAPLDEDKATLCIRFKKNPTFEDFYAHIMASNK